MRFERTLYIAMISAAAPFSFCPNSCSGYTAPLEGV